MKNDSKDREASPLNEETLGALRSTRRSAPPDFASGVMARLPAQVPGGWRARRGALWPDGQWLLPALAGAAVALAIVAIVRPAAGPAPANTASNASIAEARTTVRFELTAPGAQSVELVGSFNDWQPGTLVLKGPDASGRWSVDVALPSGRHEYQFLVDGREWVVDQKAPIVRPDGFGRMNAVVEI